MTPKVVVRNLWKRYRDVEAARGVSFEIAPGEVFGLLGPNGAGKTTTVECVLGMREPDEGEIEICGVDARRDPRGVRQKVGAALQTTALQDKITPREALHLFASFYREHDDPEHLLERFAIAAKADAAFDTLSEGQRQRLALALAFLNRPELVFLDEPTAGLDAQSRRDLHGEIARLKRDGHTVLLTTHDIDEAERLCDRVAILHQGRIVASGVPSQLIARSTFVPSIAIDTNVPLDASWLAALPGVQEAACDGCSARVRSTNVGLTVSELARELHARGIELAGLHVQKATLEDVFLELTGTRLDN